MSEPAVTSMLRIQPIRAKSEPTTTVLLLSAAQVVHAVGVERLTSELVAIGSGMSIGSVYRYFRDRFHILEALGKDNTERFTTECLQHITVQHNATWLNAIERVLDYIETQFATQPGFRSIRFGDHLDGSLRSREESPRGRAANNVAVMLSKNYPLIVETEIVNRIEVALVLHDALLSRAFAQSDTGDMRMIAQARQVALEYLTTDQPDEQASQRHLTPRCPAEGVTPTIRAERVSKNRWNKEREAEVPKKRRLL